MSAAEPLDDPGIDYGAGIFPQHAQELAASKIHPDIARERGTTSVDTKAMLDRISIAKPGRLTPGLLFPIHGIAGVVGWQYKPDDPRISESTGRPIKYETPTRQPNRLDLHPRMHRHLSDPDVPLFITEGIKKVDALLTAGVNAPVGLTGVWNWRGTDPETRGKRAVPDWQDLALNGRTVYIGYDHDVMRNSGVRDAAVQLAGYLRSKGATVWFVWVPMVDGDPKTGVDDFLAAGGTVQGLISTATRSFAPPDEQGVPPVVEAYFDTAGIKALSVAEALHREAPFAISSALGLCAYNPARGIFEPLQDKKQTVDRMGPRLARLLGDRHRSSFTSTVMDVAVNVALAHDMTIPLDPDPNWLCLTNGMLDLTTLKLDDHDPKYRATTAVPVAWDPDATCPTILRYLEYHAPGQVDIILDVLAQVFDPRVSTPPRHLFALGPTRSGKSTLIRLATNLAGKLDNVSAETLHAFATDKFAAAEVYRKLINAAADLSAEDVADLSMFKNMTGGDETSAQSKYGQKFSFTSTALFLFSANSVPWMRENSGAVLARLVPVAFPISFAGHEDEGIERRLMTELPGLLTELVRRATRATRSNPQPIPPVRDYFERHADKVRAFISETCEPVEDGQVYAMAQRSSMYPAYKDWCETRGHPPLGRNQFLTRLDQAGYPEIRTDSDRLVSLRLLPSDQWTETSDDYAQWRDTVQREREQRFTVDPDHDASDAFTEQTSPLLIAPDRSTRPSPPSDTSEGPHQPGALGVMTNESTPLVMGEFVAQKRQKRQDSTDDDEHTLLPFPEPSTCPHLITDGDKPSADLGGRLNCPQCALDAKGSA